MHRPLTGPALIAIILLFSGCGDTGNGNNGLPFSFGFGGADAYVVLIEGDIAPDLRGTLEANSQLVQLRREPPASRAALRRRIAADMETLRAVLRAEGFYGGSVEATTDGDTEPPTVRLDVSPGKLYLLRSFEISYAGDRTGEETLPVDAVLFGFAPDMPGRSADIVAIGDELLEELARSGRPLARLEDRRAVVDHDEASMAVRVLIDPGPPARFGPLSITGLAKVEEDYLRQILEWPEDEIYDRRVLTETRRTLAETNLFDSIRIEEADTVTPQGMLPVGIDVTEAKHRTIGAGVKFSTAEGLGGELSWEHRNLSGRQERLRLSAEASEIRQEGSADFRKPHFLQRDLVLLLNGTGRAQSTDAYDEKTASGVAAVEKPLGKTWIASAGISAEYSRVKDRGIPSTFTLLGLPLSAKRYDADDILDPRQGTRLRLDAIPYAEPGGNGVRFAQLEATGSAYFGFGEGRRVVPALRARIGSIVGEETLQIPANKRFYAGGGGSVRGYEFQKAGPLDPAGDPIGGRSILEAGFELRWQLTEKIGFVPFVEGGNVYDSVTPDFGEDLFWAAGLGLRYFTIAGPIRLDMAFPLNKRDGIDDDYQIYISLGQAF
ncbi:MAG: outer membrane protein assembly factor [Rhodospirillales bacterium]|nr:MAG: outer membrane protein assembly factor [Rhodospirillales bacterium]